MDQISWSIAKAEWLDQELEAETLFAINCSEKYFSSYHVEILAESV